MKELLRDNIRNLVPYSCARDEFSGEADVYLDANENWREFINLDTINRYPDPVCTALRKKIEQVMLLPFENTVIGNGSDEIIDNLVRMFCNPGKDSIVILPPTYGAYKVFADVNNVQALEIPLLSDFTLDMDAIKKVGAEQDPTKKLLFCCSPNNPTGNAYSLDTIEEICKSFPNIVVVDEAYVDFSDKGTAVSLLSKYPNLVVLRTFSKCWALAGARVGILVASSEICQTMRAMKYPYNVGLPSQRAALHALNEADAVRKELENIKTVRNEYSKKFQTLSCVTEVYPSDANFLLIKTVDATALWHYLTEKKIIVRNRTTQLHCENCLRIAIGSEEECRQVYEALASWRK